MPYIVINHYISCLTWEIIFIHDALRFLLKMSYMVIVSMELQSVNHSNELIIKRFFKFMCYVLFIIVSNV